MVCECKVKRVANISAKCSDLFNATIGNADYNNSVIETLGIGEDDYVRFSFCLECGQIYSKFPRPELPAEETCEECGSVEFAQLAGQYSKHCVTCGLIKY